MSKKTDIHSLGEGDHEHDDQHDRRQRDAEERRHDGDPQKARREDTERHCDARDVPDRAEYVAQPPE
jgi:hypothetical protein